jgi:hypothetical protein
MCPDAESLAALIDGRADGDVRSALLAHLERCPLCLDVYIESNRFVHTKYWHSRPTRYWIEPSASGSPPALS